MRALLLAQVASPYVGHGFPPHWGWYIVLYFFLGGLSAGAYVIATLLLLGRDPRDREVVRLGFLISFPLLLVCAVLLILDLGVPLRFWHMLVQSEDFPGLLFKPWSLISVGTWILTGFALFSSVAFIGALVGMGRVRWNPAIRATRWAGTRPGPLRLGWNIAGMLCAFALAGYTGVLVTATTIPVWHNARLLGGLFLASGVSASYALLTLLLLRRGRTHGDPTVAKLERADRYMMGLELVLLAALLLVLGRSAEPLLRGGFGILFWIGVVGIGLVVPLILHRGAAAGGNASRRAVVTAACVMLGGLLLRFVVVMAPQYPAVRLWDL
jgi:formate-dependent nitrite reductase membrane component NrfD